MAEFCEFRALGSQVSVCVLLCFIEPVTADTCTDHWIFDRLSGWFERYKGMPIFE